MGDEVAVCLSCMFTLCGDDVAAAYPLLALLPALCGPGTCFSVQPCCNLNDGEGRMMGETAAGRRRKKRNRNPTSPPVPTPPWCTTTWFCITCLCSSSGPAGVSVRVVHALYAWIMHRRVLGGVSSQAASRRPRIPVLCDGDWWCLPQASSLSPVFLAAVLAPIHALPPVVCCTPLQLQR